MQSSPTLKRQPMMFTRSQDSGSMASVLGLSLGALMNTS